MAQDRIRETLEGYERDIVSLRAINADLLAALKAAEWICDAGLWYCPRCKQQRAKGHMPDCQLAAALAKAKGE